LSCEILQSWIASERLLFSLRVRYHVLRSTLSTLLHRTGPYHVYLQGQDLHSKLEVAAQGGFLVELQQTAHIRNLDRCYTPELKTYLRTTACNACSGLSLHATWFFVAIPMQATHELLYIALHAYQKLVSKRQETCVCQRCFFSVP
jgi:multimeric flavodoxin WrbA